MSTDNVEMEGGVQGDAGSQAGSSEASTGTATGSLLAAHSAPQAPVNYDLQLPEGMQWSREQTAAFSAQAKELNLDANGAQKLLDMSHKNHMLMKENHEKQVTAWREQVAADKDMGGAALETTVSHAKATLNRFDQGGKLFEILEQTGYSNHPDIIRFLAAVGKEHAEDSVVLGRGHYGAIPRHERMYGKYNT